MTAPLSALNLETCETMASHNRAERTSQLGKSKASQPDKARGRKRGRIASSHADNTPGKQRERPVGTAHAISNFSEASSPAQSWGGSRNSASRMSDSISLEQASNVIAAAQFAQSLGMPFNRHISIHWEHAGVTDERAAWATGRFLKLAADWIANFGGRIAYAWVRENDPVSGRLCAPARKGSHVHILLHLPAGLGIGRMQRRWLRSIAVEPYRARTIKTSRIGGTANASRVAPAVYETNLESVIGYLLKGACPLAGEKLGLTRLEAGGRIIGKRVSTSENVGRTARSGAKGPKGVVRFLKGGVQ